MVEQHIGDDIKDGKKTIVTTLEHDKATIDAQVVECMVMKLKTRSTKVISKSNLLTPRTIQALPGYDYSELELGKLLGSGTFSMVYELRSIDPSLCETTVYQDRERAILSKQARKKQKGLSPFAVKHLRQGLLGRDEGFRDAALDLLMEAHFLATFSHPHIITLQGVAAGGAYAYVTGRNDSFFLILNRIESTLVARIATWRDQLKRFRSLEPPWFDKIGLNDNHVMFGGRLRIISDISSALVYLHKFNLIYRDLKPENIGFDIQGVVKLFDFGLLVEIPKNHWGVSSRAGTFRYMAPECCLGKVYTQSVDVYALSLVMWECFALKKPFLGLDNNELRTSVAEGGLRPDLFPHWPIGVCSLMYRSWDVSFHKRPTMKKFHHEVLHEIEKLKAQQPIHTESKCIEELGQEAVLVIHPK